MPNSAASPLQQLSQNVHSIPNKMKVTIEENEVVIRCPIGQLALSSSGKSYLVATTNGFLKTALVIKERPVSVSLNVIIPKDKPANALVELD